jgi:hypothetical protein
MKKSFVPFGIANKLKEKKFDEPCVCFYKDDEILKAVDQHWGCSISGICKHHGYKIDDLVLAPIYQQVIDWLREKHNIHIIEQLDMTCDPKYCYEIYKYEYFGNWTLVSKRPDMFLYLDPIKNLNAAIEEALELIENKE